MLSNSKLHKNVNLKIICLLETLLRYFKNDIPEETDIWTWYPGHGFAELTGEGTDEIILETLNYNLDLEIATNDIEKTHRLGRPRQSDGRRRAIIVKFVRCNYRNKVFSNKKKLKGKIISIRLRQLSFCCTCRQTLVFGNSK